MTFPDSVYTEREPHPVEESLMAHGYTEANLGKPIRDEKGI